MRRKFVIFVGILKYEDMAQSEGVTVERTSTGVPRFITIDVRKHADVIPFLERKGICFDQPIKWSAKMKRSLEQARNGEWKEGDIKNFWDV